MKNYIYIAFVVLYSCSSSVPDEYVQKMDRLTAELKKTKAIASLAVSKVNELEEKLNISIEERDSIIYDHKQETALLRASDSFHKGNNALFTKQYKKAIEHYLKTVQYRPNDAHAFNNLGNAYKEIGNYTDAINCYNRAIFIKPDYASAHYNLGIVYQKINEFDTALESYRQAARLAHGGVRKWLKDGGYYW